MPTYSFICDSCKNELEEFLPFSAKLPSKCPKCGEKGEAFHQDYTNNNITILDKNPKTFGQQAELNARKAGKEKMQIMAAKDKNRLKRAFTGKLPPGAKIDTTEGEVPFWRDTEAPTKLGRKSKIKDINTYIEKGE